MSHLPISTFLGNLVTREVFEFYDVPMLFTCSNDSNQIFIVVSIEETVEGLKWLYSPISDSTLEELRKGFIDFRKAFQSPVNRFVFIVTTSEISDTLVQPINIEDIPDEWLPFEGEKVEVSEAERTIPYCVEAKPIADKLERGVLNVLLDVQGSGHEVPARYVGKIISDLQKFIDALGLKHSGHKHSRKIPKYITNQTDLNVAFSFPGSFGIQLRSVSRCNDPSFTLVEEAILNFINLINSKSDVESLGEHLYSTENKVVSSFSNLLETIDHLGVGFYCQYASPKHSDEYSAKSSRQEIVDKLAVVKSIESSTETVDVIGILTCINVRTKYFEIVPDSGPIYSGRILDEAFDTASCAPLNKRYNASIVKISEIAKTTGLIQNKYYLLSLEATREGLSPLLGSNGAIPLPS